MPLRTMTETKTKIDISKLVVLGIIVMVTPLLFGLFSSYAAVSVAQSQTSIYKCGNTITANATLTDNLAGSGGNCLVIGTDNITLDCGGYSILGNGSGTGIYISGKSGVIIKNCVIGGFYDGIVGYHNTNLSIVDSIWVHYN